MNREDIIALAMEAGFSTKLGAVWVDHWEVTRLIERFAALIAAAERKACAKVCEETDLVEYEHCMVLHIDGHATLRNAAAAIRARGQQ